MARVKANGIEIEYEATGDRNNPALLLGHDFPARLIPTIADRIAGFCKGK